MCYTLIEQLCVNFLMEQLCVMEHQSVIFL